jgi:hypothetical protein
MGLIGHSKRSVTNCQPTLRNIPEEQISHLPCGRSWKSRIPEEINSHLSLLVCFLQCRNLNLTLAGPCIIIQFKYINQPDATVPQVYYLTFMCSSTCFGHFHAHHQELTTALTASGFTLERCYLFQKIACCPTHTLFVKCDLNISVFNL